MFSLEIRNWLNYCLRLTNNVILPPTTTTTMRARDWPSLPRSNPALGRAGLAGWQNTNVSFMLSWQSSPGRAGHGQTELVNRKIARLVGLLVLTCYYPAELSPPTRLCWAAAAAAGAIGLCGKNWPDRLYRTVLSHLVLPLSITQ